jgi:4-hydroxybenzoate polyprenyltransferase
MLSGATYIINDIVDVESDRLHPKKRNRPIASGALPVPTAIVMAVVIIGVAATAGMQLGIKFELTAALYCVLTLSYSLWLKHIVIIDLLILASGFVLRAIAGAWAIPVGISAWLVLCTMLLALFLGIEKRQGELTAVLNGRKGARQILSEYSSEMLAQMSTIVTSALLMSYALYTIQSDSAQKHHYLMATIPFVLYGIFRYLYLVHRRGLGESPDEVLIKDKPLLLNIFLWAAATGLIVALSH